MELIRIRWLLFVALIATKSFSIQAQPQAGLLYVTANMQEQTIALFGMPAIAPKPLFPATQFGDNTRIRGDRFGEIFFSATMGYHFTEKLRADVGLVFYTGVDSENGTYRLGRQGATFRTEHSVRAIDVPVRGYYNLRRHHKKHRWVWYAIGTVSYTDLRWHRYFEVLDGDNPRRTQEERSFDNVFIGSGIGLHLKISQALELYNQIDLTLGLFRGAFRTNTLLGIKLNLNTNHRYVLPSVEETATR